MDIEEQILSLMDKRALDKMYYNSFREWIPIYKEQYRTGNIGVKRELKNHIFKNWNLTENQKEKIWEEIVRC